MLFAVGVIVERFYARAGLFATQTRSMSTSDMEESLAAIFVVASNFSATSGSL